MKWFCAFIIGCFSCLFAHAAPKEVPPVQQTLSIIKPDAVAANHIGDILVRFEKADLRMVAAKMTMLTQKQAEDFYSTLRERSFFKDLVAYMTSGPIFVQVLEGPDAVAANRKLMGDTNPKKAAPGTIRAVFGTDIEKNAVHGSDSLENAKKEISFFFQQSEIFSQK